MQHSDTKDMRPIPGYKGYFAHRDGHIWSCRKANRTGSGWIQSTPADCNKPYGYQICYLKTTSDGWKTSSWHKLVALAFFGPMSGDQAQVHHINHRPNDNRICNLKYTSAFENTQYSITCGARQDEEYVTVTEVITIRRLYWKDGLTRAEVSRRTGRADATIRNIVQGIQRADVVDPQYPDGYPVPANLSAMQLAARKIGYKRFIAGTFFLAVA